ncbi:MAG: MgtC/SapB family protein [Armatimonadota bacterium]
MNNQFLIESIIKLLVSSLLGGLVGFERESQGRPAGLRTHIIVCLGATLFTIASLNISPDSDPARISAQIVTGIGFLGAGTILRQGSMVRGLTTAASIWGVAAIGLCVGIGGNFIILAMIASILIFFNLKLVAIIEKWIEIKKPEKILNITIDKKSKSLYNLISIIPEFGASVHVLETQNLSDNLKNIRLKINPANDYDEDALLAFMAKDIEILSFSFENL